MFIYVPLKSNSTESVKVVNNEGKKQNPALKQLELSNKKIEKYKQLLDNSEQSIKAQNSIIQKLRSYIRNEEEDSVKKIIADLKEIEENLNEQETIKEELNQLEDNGPDPVTSMYSKYIEGIDEGEKLLCFFVPGCEHCQIAAKQITDLSKEVQNFPDVVIVFMDEETDKIPDFFEIAGKTYNYQIMDIYTFMEVFWFDDNDTPGVVYLHNGNVLAFYQGSEESGSEIIFNPEELREILENE